MFLSAFGLTVLLLISSVAGADTYVAPFRILSPNFQQLTVVAPEPYGEVNLAINFGLNEFGETTLQEIRLSISDKLVEVDSSLVSGLVDVGTPQFSFGDEKENLDIWLPHGAAKLYKEIQGDDCQDFEWASEQDVLVLTIDKEFVVTDKALSFADELNKEWNITCS